MTAGSAAITEEEVELNVPRYSAVVVEVEITQRAAGILDQEPDHLGYSLYPNPSDGHTTFSFRLAQSASVTLQIKDMFGRRVVRLAEGQFSAGTHQIDWDGQDQRGAALPTGIYFGELTTSLGTLTQKIVIE